MDVLLLAFTCRRFSDKVSDNCEIGIKRWNISSLGWRLLVSLGQDELVYTNAHPLAGFLTREASYGGKIWAKVWEFETSATTASLNSNRSQLNSNAEDNCEIVLEQKT